MNSGEELVTAAKAARSQDHLEAAAILYTHAAGLAREAGNLLAYAHRLRHAADLHQERGCDADAAPLYAEALAVYRADPATPVLDLANLLRPLAMLKERAGERAEAAALWTEAKALYEKAGVEAGVKESERRRAALG